MESIKFDKYDCEFKSYCFNNKLIINNFFKPLGKLKNMKMNDLKCAVCLESTMKKLKCNHILCIPCADQIVPMQIVDNVENLSDDRDDWDRPCPLCRKCLIFN